MANQNNDYYFKLIMHTPLLSAIIPIYNSENTLSRCIQSLFAQTIVDKIELIFVDDKSTDNSIKILLKDLKDSKINNLQYQIIRLDENKGSAYSRMEGIRSARGKYIGFCDSDDWLENDMFERMISTLEVSNADIVECSYYINNEKSESIHLVSPSSSLINDMIANRHPTCLWNKVFKRNLFEDDDIVPYGGMGEDFVFCIQAFLKSHKYKVIDSPLYHYWQNSKSLSNSLEFSSVCRRAIDLRNNSIIVFNILKKHGLDSKYKDAIIVRKVLSKVMLSSLMHKKEIRSMFYNDIFPEIRFSILFKNIPFAYKKAYFLASSTIKCRLNKYGH